MQVYLNRVNGLIGIRSFHMDDYNGFSDDHLKEVSLNVAKNTFLIQLFLS